MISTLLISALNIYLAFTLHPISICDRVVCLILGFILLFIFCTELPS